MSHRQNNPSEWRSDGGSRGRRVPRRGFITLLMVLAFITGLTGVALVLNWTFATLAQRNMQQQTDVLALAAVAELLDEGLLSEAAPDQTDDLLDAQAAVESFRLANAAGLHPRLALDTGDLSVSAAYVADVTQPANGANFDAGPPYNTLRVRADRDPAGTNPVQLLIRGLGGADAVRIKAESLATLDSRVVGFAPTVARPTPLVPLAIDATAWFSDRVAANDDSFNLNGRKELDAVLRSNSGSGSFNAVLVDFDGGGPDFGPMPAQIVDGVTPADLGGPNLVAPVALDATQDSPGDPDVNDIVAAFVAVAGSSDTRRIFPIYTTFGGSPVTITGFIAADVLEAENIGGPGDGQLRVRIEPAFIVHATAITDPAASENIYLHKIRVTR